MFCNSEISIAANIYRFQCNLKKQHNKPKIIKSEQARKLAKCITWARPQVYKT